MAVRVVYGCTSSMWLYEYYCIKCIHIQGMVGGVVGMVRDGGLM